MSDDEPIVEDDGAEPPPRTDREDIADMIQWALMAAAITLVFGAVLDVLEAWL